MDEATQIQLVRKAIMSGLGGCCEWDEKAARRVRLDRSLEGLTPEAIKDQLQEYVAAHPEAITARPETREEYRGVCDLWFRVILPVPTLTHGLFVELVLEENPDPDVPAVAIVNAHEQRR